MLKKCAKTIREFGEAFSRTVFNYAESQIIKIESKPQSSRVKKYAAGFCSGAATCIIVGANIVLSLPWTLTLNALINPVAGSVSASAMAVSLIALPLAVAPSFLFSLGASRRMATEWERAFDRISITPEKLKKRNKEWYLPCDTTLEKSLTKKIAPEFEQARKQKIVNLEKNMMTGLAKFAKPHLN